MSIARRTSLLACAVAVLLGLLPAAASAQRTVLVGNSDAAAQGLTAFNASAGGPLSLVAGTPVAAGDGVEGVAISPDARFAYTADFGDDTISRFTLSAAGVPTAAGTTPAGDGPTDLTFTPDGKFLICTNRSGGDTDPSVSVFAVDGATGALTPVPGSPFDFGVFDPRAAAVAPDGDFVYISARRGPSGPPASNSDQAIVVASIGANGALTQIGGSPFYGGTANIFDIAITPGGSHMYVNDLIPDEIQIYSLNGATGVPTEIVGSPVPGGDTPLVLSVTPDSQRLYVGESGTGESVNGFSIALGGGLTQIAGLPFDVGGDVQGIAVSGTGDAIYAGISANPGLAAGLAIGTSGALSALSGSPYATGGVFPGFFGTDVTPVQTPQPSLEADPAPSGEPTGFDALATQVRGGTAAEFNWDFGDGTAAADAGPTPVHTYAQPGTYQVELTVRNDCDPDAVFVEGVASAGNTVFCNGSRTASVTKQVKIKPPDTKVDGKAKAKAKQKQKGNKVVVVAKVKAGEDLDATGKGKVVSGSKSFQLETVTKSVADGKTKKLKLKPEKGSSNRKILKLLDKGKKVKAKLKVKLADAAGNKETKKLKVKLKR